MTSARGLTAIRGRPQPAFQMPCQRFARKSVILDGTSTTICRGCMSEHRRQEPIWTSCAEPASRPSAPRSGGGAKRRALTSVSTRARCWLDDAAGDHNILRSTRVQFLSVPRARQHVQSRYHCGVPKGEHGQRSDSPASSSSSRPNEEDPVSGRRQGNHDAPTRRGACSASGGEDGRDFDSLSRGEKGKGHVLWSTSGEGSARDARSRTS